MYYSSGLLIVLQFLKRRCHARYHVSRENDLLNASTTRSVEHAEI